MTSIRPGVSRDRPYRLAEQTAALLRAAPIQIYRVSVSASLSPEEIRAAAEIHSEISPEYRDAVLESFIERVGKEIDARVDSRLATSGKASGIQRHTRRSNPMALAIVSMALGIPLTAISLSMLSPGGQLPGLFLIWAAITAINVCYGLSARPPRR